MNKHVILGALLVAATAVACGGGTKPGHTDAGIDANNSGCGSANPFGACGAGEKCTWIVDADDPTANNCAGSFIGHVGCAPVGQAALAADCGFQGCNDGTSFATGTFPCSGKTMGASCTSTTNAGTQVTGSCNAAGACEGSDGTCSDGLPHIAFDDCSAGLFCISRRCETICNSAGGSPSCDDLHACSLYTDVFGTGNSNPIAGVCDERCDPNTQRTLAGSAEACRSAHPAQVGSGSAEVYPEFGCYEDDSADQNARLVDFTCADTPFGRSTGPGSGVSCISSTVTDPAQDHQDCTDPESCTATVNGMVFTIPNGCAPGYVNLINEKQGSTQAICSAYCFPVDTDIGSAASIQGDVTALGKDVTDTAPVAGRATCRAKVQGGKAGLTGEQCQYFWPYDFDQKAMAIANLGPTDIDTVGVCVVDSNYEYDPTNSGGSATKQVPSCDTLLTGDFGDNANCAGSGDMCGSNFQCIGTTCHDVTVACGSGGTGSGEGSQAADCFAAWHEGPVGACYNAVREGFLMIGSGSGSATTPPHVHPAFLSKLEHMPQVRATDNAPFRRPGGIH